MIKTTKTEKALLVVVLAEQEPQSWPYAEIAQEFKSLVRSTGLEVEDVVKVKLKSIHRGHFIGKGKMEELYQMVVESGVDAVIFDNNLSPMQQRNLEKTFGVKTIDRTQLILDIFADHARTQEGSLQVELAQLEYLLPRLRGKGLALTRQAGGIGTRGPGEKKLEIDRRRIDDRISRLKKELVQVRKHRDTMRKKRQKEQVQMCSLVGYTNAGKSTTLNALTGDEQKISSRMFTTLDPVSRTFALPNEHKALISDTVGFIYKLPPYLVESFKATLEELHYADVLLHVVDAANPNFDKLIDAVNEIIEDLDLKDKPILLVFNKIDLIDQDTVSALKRKYREAVFISALQHTGLDLLKEKVQSVLYADSVTAVIKFSFAQMSLLDWLHNHAEVKKVDYGPEQVTVLAVLKRSLISHLNKTGAEYTEI